MKTTTKTAAAKFETRVRFNWGFWDAIADRQNARVRFNPLPASDKAYTRGYFYGLDANLASQTSDAAWTAYRAAKANPFAPRLEY